MYTKKLLPLILIATVVWFVGCRRHSANEKRYDLKGKVVAVEKDKRLVTIAHEEIKGYMPGMVMPFTIKDDWPFEIPLVPGDQITATLVVDGTTSWLEDVVIAKESTETGAKAPDG